MSKTNGSIEKGLGFGITTVVITTLGIIVGLDSITHSLSAVLGGIIILAVADAFSDALGIHVSEECIKRNKPKHIWTATLSTFLTKFIFTLTFIIPFLIFELALAIKISILWGFIVLIAYNYRLAKIRNEKPLKIIGEHVLIAIVVVIITHYVGHIVQLLS